MSDPDHLSLPDNAESWFALYQSLAASGETSSAQIAMLQAVRAGFKPDKESDAATLLAAFRAFGEESPRFAEILKPCPLVGSFTGTLDPRTERMLTALFDAHLEAFLSGQTPTPRLAPMGVAAGAVPSPQSAAPFPPLRILLLFIETNGARDQELPNDILQAHEESARRHGFDVMRSTTARDILHPSELDDRTPETFYAGLQRFQDEIDAFKPDIVIKDGNFLGGPNMIEPYHFADRADRGYKLVTVIGDLYEQHTSNLFDYWGAHSDLVVYYNKRTTYADVTDHRDKGLFWPCVPLDPETFDPGAEAERQTGLCLLGHAYRERDLYALLLDACGVDGLYQIHDRSVQQAVSRQAYFRQLGRSKLVFNNGYVSANVSINTGRAFEALLSGAVLLNESGDDLDALCVPFVHFVPFANFHQLAALATYLLRHDDRRRDIARRGKAWAESQFVARSFWASVLRKLGFIDNLG